MPILTAFAEGKTIQFQTSRDRWIDHDAPAFGHDVSDYRVKPAPVYRPFKNGEELAAEYCKRFGVEEVSDASSN